MKSIIFAMHFEKGSRSSGGGVTLLPPPSLRLHCLFRDTEGRLFALLLHVRAQSPLLSLRSTKGQVAAGPCQKESFLFAPTACPVLYAGFRHALLFGWSSTLWCGYS